MMSQSSLAVRPSSTSPDGLAALVQRLESLGEDASQELRENYKLLLCMAAGGLAPRGTGPSTPERQQAFAVVLESLKRLALPGSEWAGRPPLMTDALFSSLRKESRARRATAKLTDRYHLAKAGPVARQFATSQELTDLVTIHYPGVTPTGIGTYIYYDTAGDGLDPHVDTEIYAVNVILMIDQNYTDRPSRLLLYSEGIEPNRILLAPGEMAIINAGGVVHAREDMKADENVHILTVGFA